MDQPEAGLCPDPAGAGLRLRTASHPSLLWPLAWKEVLGVRVRGASTLFALSPEGSQPGISHGNARGPQRAHSGLGLDPGHSSQARVLGAGGGSLQTGCSGACKPTLSKVRYFLRAENTTSLLECSRTMSVGGWLTLGAGARGVPREQEDSGDNHRGHLLWGPLGAGQGGRADLR